jgi:hypothetical protein
MKSVGKPTVVSPDLDDVRRAIQELNRTESIEHNPKGETIG